MTGWVIPQDSVFDEIAEHFWEMGGILSRQTWQRNLSAFSKTYRSTDFLTDVKPDLYPWNWIEDKRGLILKGQPVRLIE